MTYTIRNLLIVYILTLVDVPDAIIVIYFCFFVFVFVLFWLTGVLSGAQEFLPTLI